MMFNLIRKDILTISKDRSELIILLLMPFILIVILGFSLGGLMQSGGGLDPIPIAVVSHYDESESLSAINETFYGGQLSETDQLQLAEGLVGSQLIHFLEDLAEEALIEPAYVDAEEAENLRVNQEVIGVLTIPEQISVSVFEAQMEMNDQATDIPLYLSDGEQMTSQVMIQVLNQFKTQYNLHASLQLMVQEDLTFPDATYRQADLTVDQNRPITSFQYYTIGMAVMFSLYVASSVSANAFKEKDHKSLMRMMIAGERPIRYLLSKAISGFLLVSIQLLILLTLSSLLFGTFEDRGVEFFINMGLLTLLYAFVIGGLTAVLTSLTLMMSRDSVSGVFSGLLVTVFAFLGGSFTEVAQLSSVIQTIGNWTPNGAMMTLYLQRISGYGWEVGQGLVLRLLMVGLLLFIIGVFSFPKRRLV